ncbi:type I methionyl aminopeptidase [Aquihabitans sp. G128]|uniref:type I methionyl aminopeptidase n=1 Tax=Aquihabitans sp. G128 TaxID=2849779 RepID=UPI001C234080|nr:type I methionyl aminopeptidase [Aquihabitans sp. G128]QXC60326.1 type I methionyl aminopeptidase [Aquihabitans sp. G128]
MLFSRTAAVRTPEQIAVMRRAGRVVAEMHDKIRAAIRPGVTTGELDRIGREVIASRGATSNFLGYSSPPFPGVICASPNEMVVHGIPSDDLVLHEGDIISIDCGAIVDGWHGDAAFTAPVGTVRPELLKLIEVTEASLTAAVAAMVAGARIGDIGHAVETTAYAGGMSVVEGYTGHAIGQAMHEPPNVPNQGDPGTGAKLRVGNVLAVEPMLVLGDPETALLDDDWSVVTASGDWAAHAEHTIAITEHGPEILTLP